MSDNPEQTALMIMTKSFLKSRNTQRDSGSEFFQDNKIRSCSAVREKQGGLQAVGFYDKRNNTIYPTPSNVLRSQSASTHSNSKPLHAGMGSKKPLVPYHPNHPRNLMQIPSFRPYYRNSSHIEIGQRDNRDVKHYVTNYFNNFICQAKKMPISHPGITAYKNKWIRSRISQ